MYKNNIHPVTAAQNSHDPIWNHLLRLANKRNFHIYWADLPKQVNGYYCHYKRINIISISRLCITPKERNFVLAYEIGHAVLHKRTSNLMLAARTDEDQHRLQKPKQQADRFAEKLISLLERCCK